MSGTAWGSYYTGENPIVQSSVVKALREHILKCNMDRTVAEARLQSIDGEKPYFAEDAFIADIAALCSVYEKEVQRKTSQNSKKLATVLWCATAEDRLGFYFNNIRSRHSMPRSQLSLRPSGLGLT